MLVPLPRGRGRQRWVLALGALGLAGALIAAKVAPGATRGRAAPTTIPTADAVVAEVPPLAAAARTARIRAAAGDVDAAIAIARAAIDRVRADGDPRYLGQAQAALARWWDEPAPPPPLLLLRATIRQALHDFAGARVDLDRLLADHPDDAQARLTRAVVAQVGDDRATAAADCAAVTRLAGELWGAACAAPLAAAAGAGPAARARLATAIRGGRDATAAAWATTALGELDRQLGDDGAAELALRTALAAAPDDGYTLAALADLLLDAGRPAEALTLVGDRAADALALRRAIALHRLATPGAAAARAALAARFAAARARGDDLHLRERARFELEVLGDARAAVQSATAGWAIQREAADARILLDAALAARDRAAAAPVLAWMRRAAIDDVQLTRRRAAVEALP